MSDNFVAFLMGSDSDFPVVEPGIQILKNLGIRCEVKVTSAHRTPDVTKSFVQDAEKRGCRVFICAAGLAAHLAGAVAAQTVCPVIGIPVDCGPFQGLDALLSTVQMPGGIPVATMAVGKAGAKNAAYLAAEILAVSDPALKEKLLADRKAGAEKVVAKDAALQARLSVAE